MPLYSGSRRSQMPLKSSTTQTLMAWPCRWKALLSELRGRQRWTGRRICFPGTQNTRPTYAYAKGRPGNRMLRVPASSNNPSLASMWGHAGAAFHLKKHPLWPPFLKQKPFWFSLLASVVFFLSIALNSTCDYFICFSHFLLSLDDRVFCIHFILSAWQIINVQ